MDIEYLDERGGGGGFCMGPKRGSILLTNLGFYTGMFQNTKKKTVFFPRPFSDPWRNPDSNLMYK